MRMHQHRAPIATPDGSSPLVTYGHEIAHLPRLTATEERDLGRRARQGDREARNQLVRAHLALVVKIAYLFAGRGLELPDLIGEGNVGLLRAADRFDPYRGTRFSTYAAFWIKEAIRRALCDSGRPIRLAPKRVALLARWHRAAALLAGQLHRAPTADEVARWLGLSPRQVKAVHQVLRVCPPGAYPAARGVPQASMADLLPDHRAPSPDAIVADAEDRLQVRRLLETLDHREANVLRLRFGFEEEPATLQQIGHQLGLTRERVRQIEVQGLRTLASRMQDGLRRAAPAKTARPPAGK